MACVSLALRSGPSVCVLSLHCLVKLCRSSGQSARLQPRCPGRSWPLPTAREVQALLPASARHLPGCDQELPGPAGRAEGSSVCSPQTRGIRPLTRPSLCPPGCFGLEDSSSVPTAGTALTSRSLSGRVGRRRLRSHGSSRQRTRTRMHAYAHVCMCTRTACQSLRFRSGQLHHGISRRPTSGSEPPIAWRRGAGGLNRGACHVPPGPAAARTPRPAPKPACPRAREHRITAAGLRQVRTRQADAESRISRRFPLNNAHFT